MSAGQVVLTLGVAVIAAGAGIAGSVLGPTLGARQAHLHWLRDKRAEVLERFHAVLVEALNETERWEAAMALQQEWKATPAADDLLGRFRDAASALGLYATPDLAEEASWVWRKYRDSLVSRMLDDESDRVRVDTDEFQNGADGVRMMIRGELGVK